MVAVLAKEQKTSHKCQVLSLSLECYMFITATTFQRAKSSEPWNRAGLVRGEQCGSSKSVQVSQWRCREAFGGFDQKKSYAIKSLCRMKTLSIFYLHWVLESNVSMQNLLSCEQKLKAAVELLSLPWGCTTDFWQYFGGQFFKCTF